MFYFNCTIFQVESRREKHDPLYYSGDLASLLDTESSERMRKILSTNVGQISEVGQNKLAAQGAQSDGHGSDAY